MDLSALKLIRPSTLLCTSLVLLLLFFPAGVLSGGGGGKKMIPPVKHLFGVGIGYQKVVHYKPVLVFQKHRRVKHRPSGWGWGGGSGGGSGGGWKGWKSYTPVVVQHHVHGKGRGHGSGGHHGGGGHHGHRPKRKRRPHYGRGWGWRRRRRPHGHSGGHGHSHQHSSGWNHHEDEHHEPEYHPPAAESSHGGSHSHGGGDEYVNVDGHGHNQGRGRGRERERHRENHSYATGYSYHGNDHDHDDHNGYESEIKEQWDVNKEEPSSSPTTSASPPPPIFPFTEPPTTDGGVTKIHKEFLRSHLRHYKELTTAKPTPFYPVNPHHPPHPKPHLMPPSHYTDLQSSEADYDDVNMNSPEDGGDDEEVANEIKRKTSQMIGNMAQGSAPAPSSFLMKPPTSMMTSLMPTMPAAPIPTLKIKPSPNHNQPHMMIGAANTNNMRMNMNNVRNVGVGEQFSDPGFFPSFDQFKRIKM